MSEEIQLSNVRIYEKFPEIRRYVFRDMHQIPGFLNPSNALIFGTILAGQSGEGITGSIAEIGVYLGRSFFLLAKLTNPGEKALGLDLFDSGPLESGISAQRRRFNDKAAKLGIDLTINPIIEGDTAKLSAAEVLALVGKIRFFHIDGGHMRCHLANDCALAVNSLTDDGVICFDDFFNPYWPEVTAQVLEFLRDQPLFQPFVATAEKIYVCHQQFVSTYKQIIKRSPLLTKLKVLETSLDGREYPIIREGGFRKARYEVLSRLALASANAFFY